MMAELCYHILDLVQNSAAAGSDQIEVVLEDSINRDVVVLDIRDNGKGMDGETVENVQHPFYTTKNIKKVGLGIPLLKETANMCQGEFSISSRIGKGTQVRAQLRKSHIDTPPLGDVAGTILTLLVGHSEIQTEHGLHRINIKITYTTDAGSFEISSEQIREQIDDLPMSHPEVSGFLREYINEKASSLKA